MGNSDLKKRRMTCISEGNNQVLMLGKNATSDMIVDASLDETMGEGNNKVDMKINNLFNEHFFNWQVLELMSTMRNAYCKLEFPRPM